jgi:hypothetical protein
MIYKGEKDIISLFPTVLPAGKSSTANPKEAELLLVAFFQAQLCIIYLINNFKNGFLSLSDKIILFCPPFVSLFILVDFSLAAKGLFGSGRKILPGARNIVFEY